MLLKLGTSSDPLSILRLFGASLQRYFSEVKHQVNLLEANDRSPNIINS